MSVRHVAIIGGGYSGTMLAINLLRHGNARVTLIERSERPGRGAAYGTSFAEHLLNVRAGRMSAFADRPDHFARWLSERGEGDAESFAQRRLYGTYLEELLRDATGDRLAVIRDEAVDVVPEGQGERVLLARGGPLEADKVVLSVGNLPPEAPRQIPDGLGEVYAADPWRADIAAHLAAGDEVLLIGTGLTAIDAALTLDARGFEGTITAMSRRGLTPHAHEAEHRAVPDREAPQGELSALVGDVRERGEAIGWQAAVDQLRPHTQSLWAAASLEMRRRFLRHLRPWWDVHRHRIAPEIASRIERMEREGRFRVAAGKLVSVSREENGARVLWRPRGEEEAQALHVRRIVNCTGPRGDVRRSGELLLDRLVASGRVRPDPCAIGLDVDGECRVVGVDGAPSSSLCAVGPMTRGAWWEIVAVPDLRVQMDALARRLNHDPEQGSAARA